MSVKPGVRTINSFDDEISTMLAELRAEGTTRSEGEFTLSPDQIREKLQRFQLADPHHFVLLIVSAAVRGGASFIRVHNDADDCILEFDGEALKAEQLGDLYSMLVQGDKFRDLALGLNSALSIQPKWIQVDSWNPQESQGARLVLSNETQDVERLDCCPFKELEVVNRVHVRERLRWKTVKKFVGRLAGFPPEGRLIAARCTQSTARVTVNDQVIGPPEFRRCLAVRRYISGLPVPSVEADALIESREDSGSMSAVLVVGGPPGWTGVQFVINGISFDRPDLSLGPGSAYAIVRSSELKNDISFAGIVEDEEFSRLVSFLKQQYSRTVDEILDLFDDYPEADREKALKFLAVHAAESQDSELVDRVLSLCSSHLEAYSQPDLLDFPKRWRTYTRYPSQVESKIMKFDGSMRWEVRRLEHGAQADCVELREERVSLKSEQILFLVARIRAQTPREATIYVNHREPPYTIYRWFPIRLESDWREFRCLFTVPKSDRNAGVVITQDVDSGSVWVESVSLYDFNILD
jgi:hypothetical protein